MAETAILIDEEETQDEPRALTIQELIDADNIAELLPEETLRKIGQACQHEYELDVKSRAEWSDKYKRWMQLAMQVREAKNMPWPNASNIKYPLLTTASIQFQARAYPAIVDGSNLVKGRVIGPDAGVPETDQQGQPLTQDGPEGPVPIWRIEPGAKRERADRVAQHMTWQLLFRMPGWEEDTDRLLIQLPIVGCVIRKTYHDVVQATNVSEMVPANDFVVSYWTKSLDSCPRMTHVLRLYPYEVMERISAGLWLEVKPEASREDEKFDPNDVDAPVEMLEQHRLWDLDGDGYPEPYVVTCTRDGDVARIAACYDAQGLTMKGEKVVRIERKQYFTKYGFIPAPDGSFYDIGFGHLLDDISAGIDTSLNQMIDAGALQNAQGGFIGSGVTKKGGPMRFRLGEWKHMDVVGGTLRDNIVPLNLPGPSAVLFNLLQFLVDAAKDITSVQDIMTGGPDTAQTATTTLAQVEQGMKTFTGIFKRIHRAFRQELKILFDLNRQFLAQEEYFAISDTPGVVAKTDYEDKDLDVLPVSDPSMASDQMKMARAGYLDTFKGDPNVNQKALTRRKLEAGSISDTKELLDVPPPPPDPMVVAEGAKLALEKERVEADKKAKGAAAAASLAATAKTLQEMGLLLDAAAFVAAARAAAADYVHELDGAENVEPTDQPGGVQPVVGQSGDAGLPGISEGPAPVSDGGMGGGEFPIAGDPGAGGGDGAIGGALG